MENFIQIREQRKSLNNVFSPKIPYYLFWKKIPGKEYKNKYGRHYHIREKYENYSPEKLIDIVNACNNLAYYAGIVDTIKELREHGHLEKRLIHANKQAKIVLPKKIYGQPAVQQYINKIKQGISYFKK